MSESPQIPRRSGRRLSPTLADVASLAGVSTSTAGRVLRDEGWPVEEVLKERVLAAAAELAYVPNIMARTLRAGAPALVGLVIGNMLDPYYGEIGEVVTRYSDTTNKMLVMVCNMQRDPKLELEYCRRLWEHRVAGLILAGGGFDQFTYREQLATLLERMERSGVVVTTLSPRDLAAPSFSVDNKDVGQVAAAELIAHGHRRVGILVGPIQNRVLQERVGGMTETFEQAGVEYLVQTGAGPSSSGPAIASMFDERPDMTAVIAASSLMSINIIHAIEATGRQVPTDVSIIGIGGKALGDWSSSRLTRVDLSLDICGRAALDYIAGRISGSNPAMGLVHPAHLVPGNSVIAPR